MLCVSICVHTDTYVCTLNITTSKFQLMSQCLGQSLVPWSGSSLINLPSHPASSSWWHHRPVILHPLGGVRCIWQEGIWGAMARSITITEYLLGVRGRQGKLPFPRQGVFKLPRKARDRISPKRGFLETFFFLHRLIQVGFYYLQLKDSNEFTWKIIVKKEMTCLRDQA